MPALDPVSRDVYADILAAFPALERARDADAVVRALRDAGASWLPAGDLRAGLSKIYVKPGKHVRILYDFSLADGNGTAASGSAADAGERVWAVGKVAHRDLVEKLHRKAAKGKVRTTAGPLTLWDHGLELEPVTRDASLSHVERLTDPAWARQYFQGIIDRLPFPAGTLLQDVTVDPFKYLPGKRIVLRYHLHGDGDALVLFAKHYDGDQGRAASEIQNHLSRALENTPGPAVVPRVYHYDPALQVSFQQAWNGQALPRATERTPDLWPRLLGALHDLHAVPLPRATRLELDARALLYKVRKDVTDITALLPRTAALLQDIQVALTDALERETPERSGFLHGSLLPSQILLGESAIAFLDFDATAQGDSLYDVTELCTSFLFEDWRAGAEAATLRATWDGALTEVERVYDMPVSRTLVSAYTLTFLLNRTHQHLKKLRPFPVGGLDSLLDVLRAFLPSRV